MTEPVQPHALRQSDAPGPPRARRRVDDFVNGVRPGELEEIARVLAPGESVRWAARPLLSFWEFGSAWQLFSALIASAFLAWLVLKGISDSNAHCPTSVLIPIGFSLPFWCILLWHMSAPWRRLHRLRRTLYIITDRRALLSEPAFGGWKTRSWTLRDNMVLRRETSAGGHGSLVFGLENIHPMFGRSSMQEEGFLCLSDLPRAERELQDAIGARHPRQPEPPRRQNHLPAQVQ